VLNDGLIKMGVNTFKTCESLERISIPSTVTPILIKVHSTNAAV